VGPRGSNPAKPYLTFTDADLRRLITHAPTGWAHQRAWTVAVLLLDTGMRIGEVLSLERDQLDRGASRAWKNEFCRANPA